MGNSSQGKVLVSLGLFVLGTDKLCNNIYQFMSPDCTMHDIVFRLGGAVDQDFKSGLTQVVGQLWQRFYGPWSPN